MSEELERHEGIFGYIGQVIRGEGGTVFEYDTSKSMGDPFKEMMDLFCSPEYQAQEQKRREQHWEEVSQMYLDMFDRLGISDNPEAIQKVIMGIAKGIAEQGGLTEEK